MNILETVRQSGSKVQVLWIALPLAALLLPGCPLYLDNGHGVSCHVNADCPSGQECVGGTCHVITGPVCTSDSMCPTSPPQHCEGMACVPGPRVCETHGDCDPLFMCDISACTPSTGCSTDADCTTSGFWCDFRGTCVPHGAGECRTATDCTSGQLCIEGACTDLGSTCQFDRDCPAGTSCVNAECTAVCTTDADCVAGDTCGANHFCEATVDCDTSATCMNGEHCVGGRCLADCHGGTACPSASRETSYCSTSDMFCHAGWQPHITCNMDSDCNPGRSCLAHVCRTPCPTMMDSECASIDSTLPHCQLDTASSRYLCVADGSVTPQCRTSADCTGTQNCVNAACR